MEINITNFAGGGNYSAQSGGSGYLCYFGGCNYRAVGSFCDPIQGKGGESLRQVLPLHPLISIMANHPPYEPYPYPVQFCRVKPGLELAYMDVGKGKKTVLMIHGLGSYAPAWTRTMEGIQSDARCIALDMPNYGRSTLGEFPVSLKWMA